MEKEFIPREQSLDLRNLGFDEKCDYFFTPKKEVKQSCGFFNYPKQIYPDYIKRPTFSQAFRYFREKYGLYHNIKMFGDWDKPQYNYIVSGKTMNNPSHMWYYESKDSYEEAELECLKKLIEIVKNGK